MFTLSLMSAPSWVVNEVNLHLAGNGLDAEFNDDLKMYDVLAEELAELVRQVNVALADCGQYYVVGVSV